MQEAVMGILLHHKPFLIRECRKQAQLFHGRWKASIFSKAHLSPAQNSRY